MRAYIFGSDKKIINKVENVKGSNENIVFSDTESFLLEGFDFIITDKVYELGDTVPDMETNKKVTTIEEKLDLLQKAMDELLLGGAL